MLQLDGLYDALVFTGSDDLLTDKHGCLAYVSPEILDATFVSGSSSALTQSPAAAASVFQGAPKTGSYSGRPADMWSLGVMLYTMLVGRYPFADADACTLFARIRRGRYPLPSEVSLSAAAQCLIRSLLAVSPADRLTAEEALAHPWFSVAAASVSDVVSPAAVAGQASSSSSSSGDSVVPRLPREKVDDLFVE